MIPIWFNELEAVIKKCFHKPCNLLIVCPPPPPANMLHSSNAEFMLGHRLRRFPNIDPALDNVPWLLGLHSNRMIHYCNIAWSKRQVAESDLRSTSGSRSATARVTWPSSADSRGDARWDISGSGGGDEAGLTGALSQPGNTAMDAIWWPLWTLASSSVFSSTTQMSPPSSSSSLSDIWSAMLSRDDWWLPVSLSDPGCWLYDTACWCAWWWWCPCCWCCSINRL